MSRLTSWFRATPSASASSTTSLSEDGEKAFRGSSKLNDIEHALNSAALIMNDDVDGAVAALLERDTIFHRLGLAVASFLKSVLGGEKEVMKDAAARLLDVENRAWAELKAAQKKAERQSGIYAVGMEYTVIMAQVQLMSSVVSVLHESVSETLRGFYRLRKAYMALDAVIEAEKQALGGLGEPDLTNPLDMFIFSGSNMSFGFLQLLLSMTPPAMSRLLSIIGFHGNREEGIRMLWAATRFHDVNGAVAGLVLLGYYNDIPGSADILPPTASSPLAEEWSVTEDERAITAFPAAKCHAMLAEMRARYPSSGLWRLGEALILSQDKRLPDAIQVLVSCDLPKMRQVAVLNAFELTLDAMFIQDWTLTRESALKCMELNDLSHCLYLYFAGCAELELYRDAVHAGEAEEAVARRKERAESLLRRAPTVAGRQKFMAKPLPFDSFVQRKISKLEARATEMGVDLADAAGVSPALEMAGLWCGTKKMGPAQLQKMEAGLAWERCTAGAEAVEKMKSAADEVCVRAVSLAGNLRCQGRYAEARALLKAEALCHDRSLIKGGFRDDHALPYAHYELAAIAWREVCEAGPPEVAGEAAAAQKEYRLAKAEECQGHLDTVAAWEPYLFDSRLGMRVATGMTTLKWFREKMGVGAGA